MISEEKINVWGARVHNLKNIDVEIPRDSLTVITGLSGSGKSSLAFDTIFAEGQRRYIETFSAYARNFLGNMERPDVDKITGLSPVISIEQKTTNKNPRSTVGTTTEIYDYLRLLYARAGTAYSYRSGEEMVKYTEEQVIEMILNEYAGKAIFLLAPLVRQRKGHYRELFDSMRRKGYLYARVDGEILEIVPGMKIDRYKNHNIEVVIDKLVVREADEERIRKSVSIAMKQGDGMVAVIEKGSQEMKNFSKRLMDPVTGIAYQDPAPNMFSFNSPEGACPHCKGLGKVNQIDLKKVIPNEDMSIYEGGIVPLGKYKNQMIFWQIESLLSKYDLNLKTPICRIPNIAMEEILYGSLENVKIDKEKVHTSTDYFCAYDGVIDYLRKVMENDESNDGKKWADQFISVVECPECHGLRLKPESLAFRIWDKNISEVANLDIDELRNWLEEVEQHLPPMKAKVAHEIIKELRSRVTFLLDVGLNYLSLNRQSASLSGGESQRIRLATQIGSQLVNVLYILDEPSIGLHQRDNERLLNSLKELRDLGNTVIVVEHDEDMMRAADWIVDIGPKAGRKGGEVVFQGTPAEMLKTDTITAQYLNGKMAIEVPAVRREGNGKHITIRGARGNNLKGVDVDFPLGKLIVVTGVSGSGKSSLIKGILYPALKRHLNEVADAPGEYSSLEGDWQMVKHVEFVDQNPIGKSTRSNPATYIKAYDAIRQLFASQPLAKQEGYTAQYFSFNAEGGRCEECKGAGVVTVEMQFMADLVLECDACHGRRFKKEILDVRYHDKNIYDVLNMTVREAIEFFEKYGEKQIADKLRPLDAVGLGYIKLGQSSSTLSGGENQRVKLAYFIGQERQEPTLFIFDEPTTGLHFHDIHRLLKAFNTLIEKGHSIIVIEHNMDVIKCGDYVIDLGPDGGNKGGNIVCCGTPEEVARCRESATGRYLSEKLRAD